MEENEKSELTHSQNSVSISKSRRITVTIIGWVAFLVLTFGMIKGMGSTFSILWFAALITSLGGVFYYSRIKKRIGKIEAKQLSRTFTPYFMSTLIFFGFGIVLLIAHFMNQDG